MLRDKIKKIVVSACLVSFCVSALGFTFPEPDWGELYREKTDMVMSTDFELYAEADVSTAPYYGEELEPRAGAYIGSVPNTAEKLLPIGSYLTNIDDMNQTDLYYPDNSMIAEDDVITMVGWTIYNLSNVNYDTVRKTLDTLSGYNKPMLIRFANEMNCSSLGDDPDKYVEIFRTVADMIHEYPNFAVVWSPNDLGALDRPFEYFYPGDEYVDWVGVSCYSLKYFQGNRNTAYKDSVYFMTGDYSWATNKIKPIMEFMQKNNINKPVMISEGGVSTGNVYGENLQAWAAPRLGNMLWYLTMKYPQIKMINYFDVHRNDEKQTYDISPYPYAVDIYNEAKASGSYLKSYGDTADFVLQPAYNAGTLTAKNGSVPLYTLAYIPEMPDLSVNYYVDGGWYHSSDRIPYICNLDINSLADGVHTLKIATSGKEKEYTFHKSGKSISFGQQIAYEEAVSDEISVTVNGRKIEFDQPPVIRDDRTLVPLRAIFEALGATVAWNGDTRTVTAVSGGRTIALTIGENSMQVNGAIKSLDVPAQIINDRTLVPVRAISEALGCSVEWDAGTRTVIIR